MVCRMQGLDNYEEGRRVERKCSLVFGSIKRMLKVYSKGSVLKVFQ